MKKNSRFPLFVTVAVLIFLYLPIIVLAVNSFNQSRFGSSWAGFSFKWYALLFEDDAVWHALKNSLIVAFSATITSTIMGAFAAFALYRYKTTWQKVNYSLIYAPLVVPDLLIGMSLLVFFVALNMHLSLFTIYIAHTTFCLSYVTMVLLARLQNFDYSIIEAAQDLGASFSFITRKVLIPSLAPGIISAALLSFTISIDDYIITSFVAGPGSSTLPIYVYGMIKFGSTPIINALSTLLLIVTFITIFITQRLTKSLLT